MASLISVIIPVYKVERYLNRCLESVVNQTYRNLEIILVDDGSPDNCPAICDEWAAKDSRIKVIHKENGGVADARNAALEVATGEYIGFVDSDDYIKPDMYEVLLKNILDYGADISVSSFYFNGNIKGFSQEKICSREKALQSIAQGDYTFGVIWNKLYKNAIVKDVVFPLLACSEDLVFNYYTFKKAEVIIVTDKPLYYYSQSEDGTILSEFTIGAFDAVKAREIIIQNERNSYIKPYAINGLIKSAFVVMSGCIQNNAFRDKKKELIDLINSYRKEILLSPLFSLNEKFKTIILGLSPSLYSLIIRRKHSK